MTNIRKEVTNNLRVGLFVAPAKSVCIHATRSTFNSTIRNLPEAHLSHSLPSFLKKWTSDKQDSHVHYLLQNTVNGVGSHYVYQDCKMIVEIVECSIKRMFFMEFTQCLSVLPFVPCVQNVWALFLQMMTYWEFRAPA